MSLLSSSIRGCVLALVTAAACNSSKSSSSETSAPVSVEPSFAAPAPATPPPTLPPSASQAPASRGAIVSGLRAEIVPVIGGLFPSAPADPAGKPVKSEWRLRVTNTTDAPIVFRTGGDDESFEIAVRGAGSVSAPVKIEACDEIYHVGKRHIIAPKGTLDVPVGELASGVRCKQTAHYLTQPGLYEVDVSLIGHIHALANEGEKGDTMQPVRLDAPTINIQAG
ncbi:MAG: hypothetical protein H0T89_28930 [Deltaproteobacteria bacterium]|nr:hypothetical protein [Deltaproteobacteria bacterium]